LNYAKTYGGNGGGYAQISYGTGGAAQHCRGIKRTTTIPYS
jgi:hypothetical protein